MAEFPHLPLPKRITAPYKHKKRKFEKEIDVITLANLQNRRPHGRTLKQNANKLKDDWNYEMEQREQSGLPDLPNAEVIPIFLKLDAKLFDPESLYSFGIEVIAEDDDGFVIGASIDNFKSLKEKIDKFVAKSGKFKDKAAQLWEIITGKQWRVDYILSEDLKAKWDQISDEDEILVDVSIACYLKTPKPPARNKKKSDRYNNEAYSRWQQRVAALEIEKDILEDKRQNEFRDFINDSGGQIVSSFVSYDDSFGCRIRINGLTLKDLVNNYQYLFDVTEFDSLTYDHPETGQEMEIELNFEAPPHNSPTVCVIDSGIQENHRMLTDAIDSIFSVSYIPGDNSVADLVANGGHGTKVAGAVLFGNEIPKEGVHQHEFWIQNARILNDMKWLPSELYPPQIMRQVFNDFQQTRLFNLSVNASRPCKTVHMSEWATSIDQLSHEKNVLFIVSAGNINSSNVAINNPGISEHLQQGRNYPQYLLQSASRIANPGQSCFALTVGSVSPDKFEDDLKESFAEKDGPAALTRTGPGLWRMIKPDVVEYGGDYVREKNANPLISVEPLSSSEVIRTTFDGTNAIGFDIGTSFAAPKVAHIAASILKEIPTASNNLIRTLVAQGARMPENIFRSPNVNNVRMFGYGIASRKRSTENSSRRITLTAESNISARAAEIYTIKIPEDLRRVGDEFDILVETSMAFTAIPRRTRRRTRSYLSTWVDWYSSKFDETYNQFKSRMTKLASEEEFEEGDEDAKNIQWCIRESMNWGTVKDLRRQDSSLQKDWVVIKSFMMPEEFSIAVVGHQGWDKDTQSSVPYSLAVSFEILNTEIDINVYNSIKVENEIEAENEIGDVL